MSPPKERSPILYGLVAAFVTACLLSLFLRYFFPDLTEPPPREMIVRPHAIDVAVWLSAIAIGILVGVRVHRNNPRYDGIHCPHCGYNLTGNVSDICPECGEST